MFFRNLSRPRNGPMLQYSANDPNNLFAGRQRAAYCYPPDFPRDTNYLHEEGDMSYSQNPSMPFPPRRRVEMPPSRQGDFDYASRGAGHFPRPAPPPFIPKSVLSFHRNEPMGFQRNRSKSSKC
uniref:Uncharacterized protein n=1 Tax=Cacopsylla melanoneura TaxID=428564 RepID=A0A8D9F8W9_9HEMI